MECLDFPEKIGYIELLKELKTTGGGHMLHPDKIRLMTRMTIFEGSEEGKKALRISKYYKNDYVRWELIKTILSVTIGYLLILALIGLYYSEYLIANAVTLDYKGIGMKILGIYLVILVVYISAALIWYSYRYSREKKNLMRYYKSLKRLLGLYQAEQKQNASPKETDRQEVSGR